MITPISGRAGRFQNNGNNYNFDDCSVKFSTVTGEITGFEDQQVDGRTPTARADGNDDFTGTVSGFVDQSARGGVANGNMPSVAGFTQGAILTNLKIFLDKAVAARYCGSSRVIVKDITYTTKQKDPAQRFTITFENAGGAITHPA